MVRSLHDARRRVDHLQYSLCRSVLYQCIALLDQQERSLSSRSPPGQQSSWEVRVLCALGYRQPCSADDRDDPFATQPVRWLSIQRARACWPDAASRGSPAFCWYTSRLQIPSGSRSETRSLKPEEPAASDLPLIVATSIGVRCIIEATPRIVSSSARFNL